MAVIKALTAVVGRLSLEYMLEKMALNGDLDCFV